MTGFVLDCSIAVAWCFEDEASEICDAFLERARDEGALVPSLWHLELGNVMIQAERRGRIMSAEVSTRLELIGDLPIVTDHETSARALPLATNDKRLRSVGTNTGVQIIPV